MGLSEYMNIHIWIYGPNNDQPVKGHPCLRTIKQPLKKVSRTPSIGRSPSEFLIDRGVVRGVGLALMGKSLRSCLLGSVYIQAYMCIHLPILYKTRNTVNRVRRFKFYHKYWNRYRKFATGIEWSGASIMRQNRTFFTEIPYFVTLPSIIGQGRKFPKFSRRTLMNKWIFMTGNTFRQA